MNVDLNVIPDLVVHDGAAFASSLDVARVFGKKHEDVLKKLRNILRDEPAAAVSFAVSDYFDPTGRKLPCFEITRDGFALLGMGFTGIRALRFKLAYIAKFNAMEAALRAQAEAAVFGLASPSALSLEQVRELLARFGHWHLAQVQRMLAAQKPGGVTARDVYEILERLMPGAVSRSVGGTVKSTITNAETWTAAGMMPAPIPTDDTTFKTPTEVCWKVIGHGNGMHPRLPPQVGTWLLSAAREGRWQQGQTDRRSLRDRAQPTYPVSQIRRRLRAGAAARIRGARACRNFGSTALPFRFQRCIYVVDTSVVLQWEMRELLTIRVGGVFECVECLEPTALSGARA